MLFCSGQRMLFGMHELRCASGMHDIGWHQAAVFLSLQCLALVSRRSYLHGFSCSTFLPGVCCLA